LKETVPNFIEPDIWPMNSPDLSPLDYAVSRALQQSVYRQKIQDIEHLKEVLRSCWDMIRQDLIDGAMQSTSRQHALQWSFRHKAVTLGID